MFFGVSFRAKLYINGFFLLSKFLEVENGKYENKNKRDALL